MTPIQMGRDPIKIRSRWCLLTGGQLNNFKKVRAHTESNFNIVFIKQTSTRVLKTLTILRADL